MSKDDFVARHVNELTGFLIEAFHVVVEEDRRKEKADAFSAARKGQFIIEQIARARVFLAKMYDDLPAQDAAKAAMEVEAAIAEMKKEWSKPRSLEAIKADSKRLSEKDQESLRKWHGDLLNEETKRDIERLRQNMEPLTLEKIHEALVKLPEADRTKHRKWMDERPKGGSK